MVGKFSMSVSVFIVIAGCAAPGDNSTGGGGDVVSPVSAAGARTQHSLIEADGSVSIYFAADVDALLAELAAAPERYPGYYVKARIGQAHAQLAEQRGLSQDDDRIVTLSMCDPANDISITEYFEPGGIGGGPLEFRSDMENVLGAVSIFADNEKPGQIRFGYHVYMLNYNADGSYGLIDTGTGLPYDPSPEDPAVPTCHH